VSDRRLLEAVSAIQYNLSLSAEPFSVGAIGIASPAGIDAEHITVADNEARGARIMAGGILAGPTTVAANPRLHLANSIVATNRVNDVAIGANPTQVTPDIVIPVVSGNATVISDGYNLIGVEPSGVGAATGFAFGPADLIGNTAAPFDPLLLPLANNGGPTRTHALQKDSPAVDHNPGGTLLVDQRGSARPRRFGWDIGAYELGAFVIPCNDIASLIDAINTSNLDAALDEIFLDDDPLCTGYDLDLTQGSFAYNGANGLPTVTSPIILFGQGQTIRRVNTVGIPQFRIFSVEPAGDLILENVTLENGLNLNAPVIAERAGGAILNRGTLTLRNNAILRNNRSQYGGAILNEQNATLLVESSTFSGNRAFTGGAIAAWLDSTTTLRNAAINDNIGDIFGGGIATVFGADLTIERTTFARNRSESLGGGLYVADAGTNVTIVNSTFSGNTSRDDGGALYAAARDTGVLDISFSTFTNNQSRRGGGIRYFAPITMGSTIVAGNTADIFGPDASGNLAFTSMGYNLIGDLEGNSGFGPATNDLTGAIGLPLDPRLTPLTGGIAYGEIHSLQATSPALDTGNPVTFPPIDQRGFPRPLDGTGDGNAQADIGAIETNIFPILIDSDNDGFSDDYENAVGTNPNQGFAIPPGPVRRLNPVVVLDPNFGNTPRLGDLNNDNRLDRADLQILTRMAIGDLPTTPRADILGDGQVTVKDVTQFSNFIFGEIDILR
jgi:predicted outer membrane repeat protein